MRVRRILAVVSLVISSIVGFGVMNSSPAGAALSTAGEVPCGFQHPYAPNAVEYCVGWIATPSTGYSYRIETSHHYGSWGGNWDPGTWRVLVDRFIHWNGQWQERMVDVNIGDQALPNFWSAGGSEPRAFMSLVPSHLAQIAGHNPLVYRNCVPGQSWLAKSTYFTVAANGIWPHMFQNNNQTGAYCQHGSGFRSWSTTVKDSYSLNFQGNNYKMGSLHFL